MGLELRNPLVASPSPLSHTVDGIRRLADAGVGAVVLHSLFEEQLREEADVNSRLVDAGTESFAESLSYFPSAVENEPGPRRHLSLVEHAAAAVDVPVIASLNCVTPGGWTDDGLSAWMARKGFKSVDELRGMLSVSSGIDAVAYERSGYVTGLRAANVRTYRAW
jgi:dihydroorotate dehydrogenase